MQDTNVRGNGPIARDSKLSYLLSGSLPYSLTKTATFILLQITSTAAPEEPNLEKFRSVESVGTTAHTKSTELDFLHAYQQSLITQMPSM